MDHSLKFGLAFAALLALTSTSLADGPAEKLPPGVTPGWLDAAKRSIAASEYRFAPAGEGAFSAPNRAGDLRARVAGRGVEVESRTRGAAAFRLELGLVRAGRDGALAELPAGVAELSGDRVEIRRPGTDIVEWFANDERGVEQGWQILAAPAGAADPSHPLVLELGGFGSLRPLLRPQDGRVVFVDGTGTGRLLYGALAAVDAAGTRLPADLAVRDGRVQVRVADAGAIFPIAIDPLIQPAGFSFEPNVASARLGSSVATAGDVNGDGYSDVIVGSPGENTNTGKAYLFLGGPGGLATTPTWSTTGTAQQDFFGAAVATAGDLNGDGRADVVVGAPGNSAFTPTAPGYAVVYYGQATAPYLGGPITLPSTACMTGVAATTANFGSSVSTAGDVDADGVDDVMIGAPNSLLSSDVPPKRTGVVCIFPGHAGTGISTSSFYSILAPSPLSTPPFGRIVGFGASVSTAGDVNGDGIPDVLVGAPFSQTATSGVGAAFLYRGTGGNPALSWVQAGDNANANFGTSVANAGDLNGDGLADIVVGAPHNGAYLANSGAVFVFHGADSASGISVPATDCDPSNSYTTIPAQYCEFGPAAGAQLGASVATAGDLNADGYADVAIGMPGVSNALGGTGAVEIIYGRNAGGYVFGDQVLTADVTSLSSGLGASVATAGDTDGNGFSELLAGTPGHASGQVEEGLVSLYAGSANAPPTLTVWNVAPANAARTGHSLATADVNGDGRADVVIGAPLFDGGAKDQGAVFVWETPISVLSSPPAATDTFLGPKADANLGQSVANAGDVNNDGFEDVLIGAPGFDQATLRLGSSTGLAAGASQVLEVKSVNSGTRFGQSVSGAGDVNGDGFADVVVGAPNDETKALADEGVAYLFLGQTSGLGAAPIWTTHSGLAGAHLGAVVAGAGDTNGDGRSDVLVSTPDYTVPFGGFNVTVGLVQLFLGAGPGGLATTPAWAIQGTGSLTNPTVEGGDLGPAGDVDADGLADFWVQEVVSGRFRANNILVLRGQPSGVATLGGVLTGLTAAAGDLNGDGRTDLVVGNSSALSVQAFLGPFSSATPFWTLSGPASSEFGGRLATGDVNGDGISDVLVGAPGFDGGTTDSGLVSLYLGNLGASDDGLALLPKQVELLPPGCVNGCSLRVIQPGSRTTGSPGQIVYTALGRNAGGSTVLHFEWELRPLGTPLDGVATASSGNEFGLVGAFGGSIPAGTPILALPLTGPGHGHLRLRSRNPFFPRSRWLTPSVIAPNLIHLRGYPDADGDTIADAVDNCPTTYNLDQADGDADGVGDACDNCTTIFNPRVASDFLNSNPWATLTGGQRDDDHDGFGNKCDADFTLTGTIVGSADLTQFRASSSKSRTGDTCGTSGLRPCAIFDLDEVSTLIGTGDLSQFRMLSGKAAGPKCPTCPLPCEPGTAGTCN